MVRIVLATLGFFLLGLTAAETNTSALFMPRFIYGDGYYELSDVKADWITAKKMCSLMGTDLVSFETNDESNGVLGIINTMTSESFWTSGTDLLTEGSFYWDSTGAEFSDQGFNWWAPGEPSGFGNCIQAWGAQYFMWDDFDCSRELYFLCEWHNRCP